MYEWQMPEVSLFPWNLWIMREQFRSHRFWLRSLWTKWVSKVRFWCFTLFQLWSSNSSDRRHLLSMRRWELCRLSFGNRCLSSMQRSWHCRFKRRTLCSMQRELCHLPSHRFQQVYHMSSLSVPERRAMFRVPFAVCDVQQRHSVFVVQKRILLSQRFLFRMSQRLRSLRIRQFAFGCAVFWVRQWQIWTDSLGDSATVPVNLWWLVDRNLRMRQCKE